MKLFVLKTSWDHLGSKSGFPLSNVMQSVLPHGHVNEIPVPLAASPIPLHLRIARKFGISSRLNMILADSALPSNSGSPCSTDRHQHAAKQALALLQRNKDSLCLLPAAEEEFCSDFACLPSHVKPRIFTCFHQPPAWFRLNWRRFEDLNLLGGILCLGSEQAGYFRSVCDSPVHLIRHGVRHEFFQPPKNPSVRKGNRLLFVGQWLRDFETLADTMAHVWHQKTDVYLDCVVPYFARNHESLRRLAMDARVTWHADLSEEQILALYQTADLLFLPVTDAVANNALLEALACGLPVISTKVGGIPDYLPHGAGELCEPRDPLSHAQAIISWLDNNTLRNTAGVIARNHVLKHFDWSVIGNQLVDLLSIA